MSVVDATWPNSTGRINFLSDSVASGDFFVAVGGCEKNPPKGMVESPSVTGSGDVDLLNWWIS